MKFGPTVALVAVGLSGCVVGPSYREAVSPSDTMAGFAAVKSAPVSPTEPPDAWWELYKDPELDALILEAFAHNTDLRIADADLKAAVAELASARANLLPATQIETGATYGRDVIDDAVYSDVGSQAPNGWLDSLGFSASYQVDLFGQVKRGIEAAHADLDAAVAARDVVRVSVAASVTAAYADSCALGQSLSIAKSSADEARRARDATRKRADAGVDTAFDVVRADALVDETEAAIAPLEGQRLVDLDVLARLLGRAPVDTPSAVLACNTPLELAAPLPVGDGAALIRRRPDIRRAERQLAAASARVGVATASLYPVVTIGASGAFNATSVSAFGQHNALSFGLGPLISWNFPNVAQARASLALARTGDAAALARFNGAVLEALSETEQAINSYAAEVARHRGLQRSREANVQAYRLSIKRFRDGASTYLDQLSAEQSAIAADSAVAASDRQLVSDQVLLFKALGGGWKQAPP
jgi:NodT family efflux transporter outer membrane factor (OMF) lipoprotein